MSASGGNGDIRIALAEVRVAPRLIAQPESSAGRLLRYLSFSCVLAHKLESMRSGAEVAPVATKGRTICKAAVALLVCWRTAVYVRNEVCEVKANQRGPMWARPPWCIRGGRTTPGRQSACRDAPPAHPRLAAGGRQRPRQRAERGLQRLRADHPPGPRAPRVRGLHRARARRRLPRHHAATGAGARPPSPGQHGHQARHRPRSPPRWSTTARRSFSMPARRRRKWRAT